MTTPYERSLNKFIPLYKIAEASAANKELLKKVSQKSPVKRFLDLCAQFPENQLKFYFCSFTSMDKLGINPKSVFATPLGIYCYPLSYIKYRLDHGIIDHAIGVEDKDKIETYVPFSGENTAKFLYVFKVDPNDQSILVDAYNDYTEEMLVSDFKKLSDWGISTGFASKKKLNYVLNSKVIPLKTDIYIDNEEDLNDYSKPIYKIWNITRKLASHTSVKELIFADEKDKNNTDLGADGNYIFHKHLKDPKEKLKMTTTWNMLFRKVLGYNGISDLGHNIIHTNEPTQAVFFSTSNIEIVDKIILNLVEKRKDYVPPVVFQKFVFGQKTMDQIKSLKRTTSLDITVGVDHYEILVGDNKSKNSTSFLKDLVKGYSIHQSPSPWMSVTGYTTQFTTFLDKNLHLTALRLVDGSFFLSNSLESFAFEIKNDLIFKYFPKTKEFKANPDFDDLAVEKIEKYCLICQDHLTLSDIQGLSALYNELIIPSEVPLFLDLLNFKEFK